MFDFKKFRRELIKISASVMVLSLFFVSGYADDVNPLFQQKKIKNYLPHLTSKEFANLVKKTDMAIIPVGSVEQHGEHLPLGTDFYSANETAKLIAQKTDVIVSPVLFLGLAKYHMGFPGTMTLSPETFEAVLFESALSLISHGIKKIMIYNGHGGNNQSVSKVVYKINQNTGAVAVWLNNINPPPDPDPVKYPLFDWHAGVSETSEMLYLTPELVVMSRAYKPVITLPPGAKQIQALANEDSNIQNLAMGYLFTPENTGKKGSTKEMTNSGVFTMGNPADARAEYGRKKINSFVDAAVKFINTWKKIRN